MQHYSLATKSQKSEEEVNAEIISQQRRIENRKLNTAT